MVTYGNDRFANSKLRVLREAKETGWFDSARAFGPEDLPGAFYERPHYREISALPRGGGYWLWKFYFLDICLSELREGDFLVWCDAGNSINKNGAARFWEYIDIVNTSEYDVLVGEGLKSWTEFKWTTREIFLAFDVLGNESITDTWQIQSGLIIIQKGPNACECKWTSFSTASTLSKPVLPTEAQKHSHISLANLNG